MANLLTDVDIASMHYSDTSMSSNTVHTVLKDLQPHREHPSKDRQRQFAAGELVADQSIDSDHDNDDLHEYDHWFIKANKKKLRAAKLFLLGKVMIIMEESNIVSHSSSKKPATSVTLLLNRYDDSTCTFILTGGQTALLKASDVLLAKATGTGCISLIDGAQEDRLQFHINKLTELGQDMDDYVPYTQDQGINIEARLNLFRRDGGPPGSGGESSNSESEDDPYIVEAIMKKQFNKKSNQFEYFVKWKGYSSSFNTWEIISNIPEKILNDYEATLVSTGCNSATSRREGLRHTTKSALPSDNIYNV